MRFDSSSQTQRIDETQRGFLLAEFSSLREEVHRRTDIQHQLISLALVALGVFFSINHERASLVLLAYPILALFLASAWSQSDIRIRQIGAYISSIEAELLGGDRGWEHNLRKVSGVGRFGSLAFFASRGVFVGTQMVAILMALLRSAPGSAESVILGVDCFVILLTIVVLQPHKPLSNQHKRSLFSDHDA